MSFGMTHTSALPLRLGCLRKGECIGDERVTMVGEEGGCLGRAKGRG